VLHETILNPPWRGRREPERVPLDGRVAKFLASRQSQAQSRLALSHGNHDVDGVKGPDC